MSDIRSKMQKKKEKSETKTGSVISGMIGSDKSEEKETIKSTSTDIPDNTPDTTDTTDTDMKVSETAHEPKETKENAAKKAPKPETPIISSVLEYKSVPNENKTRRKQILFYPSLCAELEQIAKETGSSVNDLINQVMLNYVNKHPSAKTRKKMK